MTQTDGRPLYQRIADDLRQDITSGRYQIGDQLPTELELCDTHRISRHTAREALRSLSEEGLISRRRGSGTVVIQTSPSVRYVQPLGDLGDLLQYAREARLSDLEIDVVAASTEDARRVGLTVDAPYRRIRALRRTQAGAPPLCRTEIFIHERWPLEEADIRDWPKAISELIEARHGVGVARIDQRIMGDLANDADAVALGVQVGSAILRILRTYVAGDGKTMVVSDSRHPADRFAYAMTVRRDKV